MIKFVFQKNQSLALASIFFFVGVWLLPHHEMWRDELQAWLLARDSNTVIDLLQNLKYEGHPAVWHLLLMPLTRLFGSPVVMQYLNLLIATASTYTLARYSPFTSMQKVLLAFGYYLFYEYGIIARNYSIGVFLIFIYCALYSSDRRRYIAMAIILSLLSHTSVLGLILATALFVGVIFDEWLQKRELDSTAMFGFSRCLGCMLVLLGLASAVIQLKPPADSGYAVAWMFEFDFIQLKATLGALVDAYFPIPAIGFHYWNNRILNHNEFTRVLSVVLALFILLIFVRSLLCRPAALVTFLVANFGLLTFYYVKYAGSWRHHGFLFIGLIAALWLAPFCKECCLNGLYRKLPTLSKIALSRLFVIVLGIHLIGSVIAGYQDYKYPFSQAKGTAKFISENQLDRLEIIGDGSPQASAVVGYLNRSVFYYPDAARYGSFLRFDNVRKAVQCSEVLNQASEFALSRTEGVLLVLSYPIDSECASHHKFNLLYSSGLSVAGHENFYVYQYGSIGHR